MTNRYSRIERTICAYIHLQESAVSINLNTCYFTCSKVGLSPKRGESSMVRTLNRANATA